MAAAANAAALAQQALQMQVMADTIAALQQQLAGMAAGPPGGAVAAAAAAAPAAGLGYDPAFNAAQLALSRRAAAQPPSVFRGRIGLETHKWLQEVALYHEDAGLVTDAEKLRVTARYLQGPAQIFWEANRQLPLADPLKITTWAQLAAALRKRFEPTDVALWGRNQLASLTGKGMTNVAAYNEQFQDLMAVIPDMAEADRVFAYHSGLPAHLKLALANKSNEWLTLQQNLEATVRIEASRAVSGGSANLQFGGSSSRGWGNRQGQKTATLNAMEEGQETAAPEPSSMMEFMQSMQAQLNALQAGGGRAPARLASQWPQTPKIPGLKFELINARKSKGLCIKCGAKGHMKWECKNAADLTTFPSAN